MDKHFGCIISSVVSCLEVSVMKIT